MELDDMLIALREFRDEFARSHNYDLYAMCETIRERDRQAGDRVVPGVRRAPVYPAGVCDDTADEATVIVSTTPESEAVGESEPAEIAETTLVETADELFRQYDAEGADGSPQFLLAEGLKAVERTRVL